MSTASTGNLDCHRHRREDAAKEEEAARGRREASIKHWLACLPFSLPCFFLGLHAPHLRSWLPSGLWIGLPASPSFFLLSFYRVFHIIFAKSYLYVALKFHDAPAYFRQESATFTIFIFSSAAKIRKVGLRSTNLFNLFPLVSLYLRAVSAVSCYGIATVNTVTEEHVRIVLAEVREARGAKKPRSIAHQQNGKGTRRRETPYKAKNKTLRTAPLADAFRRQRRIVSPLLQQKE